MKIKIKIALLLLLTAIELHGQSIDNLDEKNGYKDLRFGMPKKELIDKIFDCTTDGHCLLVGDIYLSIGDVKVDKVFVKFTDDKLFVIILMIKGQQNVDKLLEIYDKTYGRMTSIDKDKTSATWEGKNVGLLFDIDVDTNGNVSATSFIASKSLTHSNSLNEIKKYKDDL